MKIKLSAADIGKILFLCFLLFLTIHVVPNDGSSILHAINLVFHEAGHPIFGLFGEFFGFLGGTLMQLLVPIIVGMHFLKQRDWFAFFVMVWWFGVNFVDVGTYMADARAQILPLIGGEHDWYYLFATMNLLDKDVIIGHAVSSAGYLCMVGALLCAFMQTGVAQGLRYGGRRS